MIEVSGKIVAFGPPHGWTIDTGEGPVEVHGLGSRWLWRDAGLPRPTVGDTLAVEARSFDCGAGLQNFAMRVRVGDRTVEIRDPATGLARCMRPRP